jgi:hypothetical protein
MAASAAGLDSVEVQSAIYPSEGPRPLSGECINNTPVSMPKTTAQADTAPSPVGDTRESMGPFRNGIERRRRMFESSPSLVSE